MGAIHKRSAWLSFSNRILNAKEDDKEIELTSALDKVRAQYGMYGVQVDGEMFDMGKPDAFRNCITNFTK